MPAPLPVVQNGKFAPRFPLNLEHRGDDVFQFGGKYIGEIENIYDLLYKILTNQEIDASLALPYAIKITEDKLYIRDKTNSEWIIIFDITKPNFPKEIELYELIYKAITHQVIGEDTSYPGQFKIEENILYVRDKDNLIWTQIGDVTKEFLGATEATQDILDQVNAILTEVQELKTELNRQIATTNETLTTALQAANEAMTSAQSINIRTFNSIEEMKASNTLKAGALAKTLGFYTAGDGGGANYVIANSIGEEEPDEATLISLQNNLYAKLLIEDYVNVKQFGAKGDGENDDTSALQLCFNYVKDGCITMPAGTYKTSDALTVDKGLKLFGYNATLKSYVDSTKCALVYSGSNSKGILEGLFIRCDNNGKSCFDLKGVGGNLTLRNCQFMFGDYGLLADNMDASSANFLRMVNCVFTHNNKKAFMLGNLSEDNFTTSCPISIIDCLIQSCGSTTDIGESTDTVPIAVYRMLDVVIQRLQIDNHQHRYNYRIGEFKSVENLTILNLNVEDFPENRTKNTNLIEFGGCINVNITNTKTWNIFPSSSRKPVLFNFNGCNGRHHAGIVTDNAGLSNYYSYGLSGNYTNNGNWTSLYMEEDLLKCSAGVLRALAKPEWTNICHCSNKSNATNNQSDNSSFNGTLPANGGSLDGGFFWRQNVYDDKCMAVLSMRCKGKAPDVDTSGRFVFEWYDEDNSLLFRDMVTTGGTIQDDRGTWYKIHRSDAPEGAKMLRYGFATTSSSSTYQFSGDSCINIYSWDVFLYYSKPIPNIPLVNGHVLNMY
ncbi:glycosyl hydrolase family 28-related protein [uncultured Megamonas sp.]|uniref:glycosyl hydrolase family 28-related protein n=1 Tax=uncultured Megamonas sp. TaxID=286140 RepID=UPI0025990648|nr:glycosyl hydrolase family 28-related protein [uncultured Megamonas sp.]